MPRVNDCLTRSKRTGRPGTFVPSVAILSVHPRLQSLSSVRALHGARSGAPERRLGCASRRGFRCFRCFRCSSRKFTASEASSSAQILACARSGDRENSKTSAVLLLFFAVFGRKNSGNRENRIICQDQPSLLGRICASYHAIALFVK